jgi:hypothetical protein
MSGYVDPFAHRWNRSVPAEDDLDAAPEHVEPEADDLDDELVDEDVEMAATWRRPLRAG